MTEVFRFRAGTKARKVFELLANTSGSIRRADITKFYSSLEPKANPRYASMSVEKILSKIGKKLVINKRVYYALDTNKIDKRTIWEKLESKLNESYLS